MAVIQKELFERITDRIGKQADLITTAVDNAAKESGVDGFEGLFYDTITLSDDYDVESSLGSAFRALDKGLTAFAVLSGTGVLRNAVLALDNHLRTQKYSSINDYCSGLDATVCKEFAAYYKLIKGIDIDNNYISDREAEL